MNYGNYYTAATAILICNVVRCFTFIKLSMASWPLACVRLVKIHWIDSTPLLNKSLTIPYPMPLLPPVTNTKGAGTVSAQAVTAATARCSSLPYCGANPVLCGPNAHYCETVIRRANVITEGKCFSVCELYKPLQEVESKLTNNMKGTLNSSFEKCRITRICGLVTGRSWVCNK